MQTLHVFAVDCNSEPSRFWPIPELSEYLEVGQPDLLTQLDLFADLYRKRSCNPIVRPEAAERLIEAQLREVGHA